ncbi:MAG: DUF1800 domain-containing protein [Acetobacteraceae bacterium]|nr:DUF1800 domain-containing protein [Acetobacteraceae bacterium]
MDLSTVQALVRFGLGRRPAEALPTDPAAWLLSQLQGPDPAAGMGPRTADGLAALRADRKNKPPPGESQSRALFRDGAVAQLANALTTQAPFRERLVWFWTNHFTVSVRRGQCAAVLPSFVAEAIRPHVTGRFADMLLAVMRHPAMLLYLDNVASIGPDSPAGVRSHRGLNENLARECMELHTLSPASGYAQADVTAFAAILTGWSIDLQADPPGFRFRPGAHQPGEQTVLGHAFPAGEAGGVAALEFLANHPATHRFLAAKLVCHFVSDDPPPAAVHRIEGVLRDTQGDLGAASVALVGLDAAWHPLTKLRTPQDLVVAGLRALDLSPDQTGNPIGALGGLGQPFWNAPAPNGWPDRAADWAAPEAMVRRVDWAFGLAGRTQATDPLEIADATLGPLLQPATQDAMRHAGSRHESLTLFLSSPEFQRR